MVQSSLSMFGIIYGFLCYSPFTFLLCKVSVSCLPPALTSLLSLVPSCQSGFSRETKPIGCVCVCVCGYEEGRGLIDLFHKTGSHNCGGLQAQNVQGRPADQRPREEMMLQFKIEGSLQAEFLKSGIN